MALNSIGSFIIFLLVLSALVFVHELGHYLACRVVGVHVEEFAVGFPPRLVGLTRNSEGQWRWFFGQKPPSPAELGGRQTIYSLNVIPLGGFVRPAGEDDPLVPGGLSASSKRARIFVLAAGAGFNLIFGFLVFTGGFLVGWPEPTPNTVSIGQVAPDSPASEAGLLPGDIIRQADAQVVSTFADLSVYIRSHLGQPIQLQVERGAERLTLTVTPRTTWPEGQGPTGIVLDRPFQVVRHSLPSAVYRAAEEMGGQFMALILFPGMILRGEISLSEARPIGPVGLNDLTYQAVDEVKRTGEGFPLIQLIGLLSVALATTNLLPLPALDGGRILFVLIEAVRGRRVDPTREAVVHGIGMILLLTLMAFITYQDIVNPVFPR